MYTLAVMSHLPPLFCVFPPPSTGTGKREAAGGGRQPVAAIPPSYIDILHEAVIDPCYARTARERWEPTKPFDPTLVVFLFIP